MAGPGKKGKFTLRQSRDAGRGNVEQTEENVSCQQASAPKNSAIPKTSNVTEPVLTKKSSRIRLFDEFEIPSASSARENATRNSGIQAESRRIAEKSSGNGMTSQEAAGMQTNRTPTSQHVGSNQAIGCESNETESMQDLESNGSDQVTLKRKRGYTRNIALSNEKKAGKKVNITVSEISGRLVGEGAQRYISEASCVIRKYGKWKAPKWGKLPKDDRDQLLRITNNSFTYDGGEHVKPALIKQLNSQYRSRRYNFHMLFKKCGSKEEALARRPEYVEESDWIYLCDYYCSPEFKALSERNKLNRSKQQTAHTAGTKSFLRHKDDRVSKRVK
ncbi:uncharacterized protein [Coffea arabica]|uniref:Uncharacterized protein n=1 Tax=Coffea arabica TaxID=13443 RepID=A0ABM4UEY4_COFAR